jgi:enolase-phosphatase E1
MIRAIVTDIEGTTTDIEFVTKTLFPYARAHLPSYVQNYKNHEVVAKILDDVRAEISQSDADLDVVIAALTSWIDADQKLKPLKDIQGLIWRSAYENAAFKGHVYQDAYDTLRAWHAAGISLYVYSSGSVAAQKLIFGYSDFGDMTSLFSGYFDTGIGGKKEASSYAAIAKEIKLPGDKILFLSDILDELNAAREAGLMTIGLNRKGALTEAYGHELVQDFSQIKLGGNV